MSSLTLLQGLRGLAKFEHDDHSFAEEAANHIVMLERQLGNLLAIIHRDGGQYIWAHGWEKATDEAIKKLYNAECIDKFPEGFSNEVSLAGFALILWALWR